MSHERPEALEVTHLRGALALLEQVARLEEQVDSLIREGGVSGHLPLVGEVMTSISDCAQMLVEDFNNFKQSSPSPDNSKQIREIDSRMIHILQDISTGMKRVKQKINKSVREDRSETESLPLN